MHNTIFNSIVIFILIIVFMYAFSVSYTADSIDNISYVIALAIDTSNDVNNLQVTFEFTDTSAFSTKDSSSTNTSILNTVHAPSINTAINLLNSYIGKEVNLSHCKVIVFSDELAKKGISDEISELMNNIQVRPSANVIICKGKSIEYIQNSTSKLEKILTKYYDIFPNSSEYTGFTSNIYIGEFYNYLTNKNCGNLAILGGINSPLPSSEEDNESSKSSSEKTFNPKVLLSEMVAGNSPIQGERGTENIGLAVLHNGVYIGDLTASDTLSHTLISGEVNSLMLSINNTEIYKKYIDVALFENNSPQIHVDLNGDAPIISIDIKLVGRISGIKDGIDYSYESTNLNLDEISNAVNTSIKGYIGQYLEKTTKEFKCDLDHFYNYAKRSFLTLQEWQNYDWASKYPNASFNVSVNSKVYYNLLNSD